MNEKHMLFKELMAVLIDKKYERVMEEEMVRVAMGVIVRFCDRYGVKITYQIKTP